MNGVWDYGGNYDTIMNVITALGEAGGVNQGPQWLKWLVGSLQRETFHFIGARLYS